jgi:hypothetical protein
MRHGSQRLDTTAYARFYDFNVTTKTARVPHVFVFPEVLVAVCVHLPAVLKTCMWVEAS